MPVCKQQLGAHTTSTERPRLTRNDIGMFDCAYHTMVFSRRERLWLAQRAKLELIKNATASVSVAGKMNRFRV